MDTFKIEIRRLVFSNILITYSHFSLKSGIIRRLFLNHDVVGFLYKLFPHSSSRQQEKHKRREGSEPAHQRISPSIRGPAHTARGRSTPIVTHPRAPPQRFTRWRANWRQRTPKSWSGRPTRRSGHSPRRHPLLGSLGQQLTS